MISDAIEIFEAELANYPVDILHCTGSRTTAYAEISASSGSVTVIRVVFRRTQGEWWASISWRDRVPTVWETTWDISCPSATPETFITGTVKLAVELTK